MHIRITVESESLAGSSVQPGDVPTFDMSERGADGWAPAKASAAFLALVPKRAKLSVDEARAEVVRLRALGHEVSGDRAAKALVLS